MTRATRMLWGRWWMLAVLPLASACEEAPSSPGRDGASRDLDFVLPAMQGTPATTAQTAWMRPAEGELPSRFALAVGGPEEPDDGDTPEEPGDGRFALLLNRYVTTSFVGNTFSFEYGLLGFGTSYAMRPRFHITRKDGSTILQGTGTGRSESIWQVPLFMRPSAREEVRISETCGAIGNVQVDYEVRLDTDKWIPFHSKASDNASSASSQPGCTAPSGGGGGEPGSAPRYVEVCYYEIWVDQYGNVAFVVPLGCEYIQVQ